MPYYTTRWRPKCVYVAAIFIHLLRPLGCTNMAGTISPEAGRASWKCHRKSHSELAMDRVCCVLLLSVLLAAAVSPSRAAPVDVSAEESLNGEWKGEKVGLSEKKWGNMVQEKIGEDNLLTGPQNDSQPSGQPEAENFQAEWTNVNITEEESDYDNGDSQEEQFDSEEPWWEEYDDWMGKDMEKANEEGDRQTKEPLWESLPVTEFWWEPEPKDEKQDSGKEAKVPGEEKIPWWWGGGLTTRPPEWARPELKQLGENGERMKGGEKSKPDKPQWWAWDVTKKPWWGAEKKAEDPWWEVDANMNIPQDKAWFPTKKQDEDEQRPDDPNDYEVLDVYIGNDGDTREDLEEIPVQQEIFPPEMKENTVTFIHEKSGSGYFWAFLATLAILVAVLYMVYHKKRLSQQKRFIFALEGGLFGDSKRPNSGEYQRLENKI